MAASVGELKDAVKEALERNGVVQQLQARLRAEVFKCLLQAEDGPRPQPSNENLVINELIREFLIYNGYRDTLSVFLPESGQPTTRLFDRSFLVQHLGLEETQRSQQVPLLYSMLAQQRAAASVPPQPCPPGQQQVQQHQGSKRQQQSHALMLEVAAGVDGPR